jgi:formate C-acetyltransferase
MITHDAWNGFSKGNWQDEINTADFIRANWTPYEGDAGFLKGPTDRTKRLYDKYSALTKAEAARGGVLDIDTHSISSLLGYEPGYLDRDDEIIVGLQTGKPLTRGVNPFGGIRMARDACEAYGYKLDEKIDKIFQYRTTHNDGVFRVYTDEMKAVRKCGIITGLPDAYGRGRIIGDYRRIALYGVDRLLEAKQFDKIEVGKRPMTEETIRLCEEVAKQIEFLKRLKQMATAYGCDISQPACSALEAVQWLYFGYLGAIREANGAAMSLGRVGTFLDIYIERDLRAGLITEEDAQEIIDQFVLKLRMARQLRTPGYNDLFAGDPMWITEAAGGMAEDGRTLVTKNSYRVLHTLYNLGASPEPNMTILWSENLPEPFKQYCTQASIDTGSIQYENDDLMRPRYGDDYAIACCVSAMRIGKQTQYFGARCNLAKALLMALNSGRDEMTGEQLGPNLTPVGDGPLDYETVMERFDETLEWLCGLYVNTMNVIHFMHDKYAYERLEMALHDTDIERFMAFGIAGLSVVADSLSAIRHAKVTPVRREDGLITDFQIEGEFPCYGNDDDRADSIAADLTERFTAHLRKHPTYRNATHTLSILTITSNVVYGKNTGNTPDGRRAGEPFAPGANPMHNRDKLGALASLNSVAKLPYDACRDGISCTFSITPDTLGKTSDERGNHLVNILDGYFVQKAHHVNVNVLHREKLIDAMAHPEDYPNLTIRVSGYAVNFHRLTREQQEEVISRTFHAKL